jgi:CHAT domain-containing protein
MKLANFRRDNLQRIPFAKGRAINVQLLEERAPNPTRLSMAALKNALRIIVVLAFAHILPAQAEIDSHYVDEELIAAGKSVNDGHVKAGLDRLAALLRQIDPLKDQNDYFRISATLIEFLSEIEDHAQAAQLLNSMISTKIHETQPAYLQWMQFYIGRNLSYSGKADEGEKFLRSLTAGDARLVHIPAQRAAAIVLSKIERDRGNIDQAAIWMRRAVIGTLVDKGAASEEIVDVLTEYAYYLTETRQLPDAYNLFIRLAPIYETQYSHHGPKYLHFQSDFLATLSDFGNFPVLDAAYKTLSDNVSAVDIVAPSVRSQLWFQSLYQLARTPSADAHASTSQKLKEFNASYPDFLKQPRNRIIFSYFALLAGDLDLADQFNAAPRVSEPVDTQMQSYEIILRSFIAAVRNKFDDSIALIPDALEKIGLFRQQFEVASSNRLPAITAQERQILSLILGLNSPHVSTYNQANVLFKLGQFLNGDKAKLGLSERVARQELNSDLQREDIRTRDRLKDLRDRMMNEATGSLLARVLPIRRIYTPVQNKDFGSLLRLEDIEDKIANADDQLRHGGLELAKQSGDIPIELSAVQRLIRPNEAMVLHFVVIGFGLVTACVDSDNWTLHFTRRDQPEIQQLIIDEKLVSAAVHGAHEPSAILDASFPAENSHRLYDLFFSGVEACISGKTHILLATDADFFALPWNALLTEAPPKDHKFHFREASWLPRSYAISLLPSVRSLYQLRVNLPPSRAEQKFLGIGAPDFGGSEHPTELALGPLFSSRGVANTAAIKNLPSLPESADELRVVANTLGAPAESLILGSDATERALRQRPLNDYRVISFATHAIVAGEVEGVTEPALVLTPGKEGSNSQNDGLLTASEIANLSLDANLVILSACNTAASDGHASGRGLSGLADAFFFAGARALAVTQWAVFSDVAQQLGAGLVSRSVKSRTVGVSEGLREAMVDYISSANEDYLANPRFWAPFIIAGDGAVRPLDADQENRIVDMAINLEWERLTPEPSDSDILSLRKTPRNESFYSIGIEKPPPNEKRAGSYLAQIRTDGTVKVFNRDRGLAAWGIISIGNGIGVLGYVPADTKSSAVFRLLDLDGQRLWQHLEDSSLWNFPITIVKAPRGYILVSIENDYSPSSWPSTLIFTLVSDKGATLTQQRYRLSVKPMFHSTKNVALDAEGNLVVAIGGNIRASPFEQRPIVWTSPVTGAERFCTGTPEATEILKIDVQSLQVRMQRVIPDVAVVSVKLNDGRLFAAGSFSVNCRLDKRIRFAELTPTLELRTTFESNNVNSLEVHDFEITSDGTVLLAGVTRTFLPTALTVAIMTLDQLKDYKIHDMWDESIWETTEEQRIAFVLALGKDGAVLGDRVFLDLRNRSISTLASEPSGRFIAVGSAFGDRGWVAGLRLGDHLKQKMDARPNAVPLTQH